MADSSVSPSTIKMSPYIYLHGRAAEARDFYANAFSGTVSPTYYWRDEPTKEVPEDKKGWVMHASVTFGSNTVYVFDDLEEKKGNNISLWLAFESVEETTRVFNALAADGNVIEPLELHYMQCYNGRVEDKFGIFWGFFCKVKKAPEVEQVSTDEDSDSKKQKV